jgi:hypothetical protein
VNHFVKIKYEASLCKMPKPKKVMKGSRGQINVSREAMKGKQELRFQILDFRVQKSEVRSQI